MPSFAIRLGALGLLAIAATPAAAQPPAQVAAQARRVLKESCHRCHSGVVSSSGYDFDVARYDTLVKPPSGDPWIVPGSLDRSPIWDAVQKRMPQKGSAERAAFGDDQRQVIRKWIEAGAPPFPAAAERPFISLKEVLTGIRDHLGKAKPEDRPYLRYFSLAHVHNNPAFEEEDLRYLRAALSKVVNSLSWKPLVELQPVDGAGTLYVVDVRKLDWDRDNMWQKLIDAYPYGLKFGNFADLENLDGQIVRDTNCQLPWLRADWFVATASRPPLYHDLLRLPRDLRVLEEKLGVNVADNFRRDQLVRGGFAKSGVSGQNRLVERHDSTATGGAYWKSYDFLPENGRANLLRFPLGPLFEGSRYADQAFRQDGGEIIFSLPNGLQAYLLVNAKDERIDAGPIDVVSDDKRVSGTPAIVNGISCHSCHMHGMIGFTDAVRDGHALFGEPALKVKRLYPEPKQMNELIETDKQRFLTALDKATARFLKAGDDRDTPLLKFKEPVTEVVVGYRRGYLSLKDIAHELYLKDPEDLLRKLGEKRLKELGLEAVSRPGGLVGRYQWEAVEGMSLMQEVARELKFTPLR